MADSVAETDAAALALAADKKKKIIGWVVGIALVVVAIWVAKKLKVF